MPDQPLSYHLKSPYHESITFVVPGDMQGNINFNFEIRSKGSVTTQIHGVAKHTQEVTEGEWEIQVELCESERKPFGIMQILIEITDSETMGEHDSPWLYQHVDGNKAHPLTQHDGGRRTSYKMCCDPCNRQDSWDPAWGMQLQNYDGLFPHPPEDWDVPGPEGTGVSESIAPPVAKVTAIYGVNVITPRCIFVKHRKNKFDGGVTKKVQSRFELDDEGDVNGLRVIDGIGYETTFVAQRRPDNGEVVYLSGDGTVNYQSLRFAKTWDSADCHVSVFELPGCDHRGVSTDERVMKLLRGVLDLGEDRDAELVDEESYGGVDRAKVFTTNCYEDITRTYILRVMAKLGIRRFGHYRPSLKYVMITLAAVMVFVSVLMLSAGFATDPDTVRNWSFSNNGLTYIGCQIDGDMKPGSGCWSREQMNKWIQKTHAPFSVIRWEATLYDPSMDLGLLSFAYPAHIERTEVIPRRPERGSMVVTFPVKSLERTGEMCAAWYKDCKEADYKFQHGIHKYAKQAGQQNCLMNHEMLATCQVCHTAGVYTYQITIFCVLMQGFLYIAFSQRARASTDSRCVKFFALAVNVVVLVLLVNAHLHWHNECYQQAIQSMATIVEDNFLTGFIEEPSSFLLLIPISQKMVFDSSSTTDPNT